MVSLRVRNKESIISDLKARTSKMPIVLDPSDYVLQLERAVRKLDELVFNPRSIVFTNASDGIVDVTALHVDEICAVYYSLEPGASLLGDLDLGIGVMPIISSQMMPLSSLDSIADYLIIKTIINHLQRKMMNCFDYTLLPLTADGRQLLQIRNPGKFFWVEYLPYLDPSASSWTMFENEYSFLFELAFAYVGYANIEITMQAAMLGVGKESATLLTYWDNKIKELIKEFQDSSLINYMG